MSDEEWDKVYAEVWHRFYSFDHMETILSRMAALRSNKRLTTLHRLLWYRDFHRLYGCHPLEGGFGRIKARKDRRSGMPLENPIAFYARYVKTEVRSRRVDAVDASAPAPHACGGSGAIRRGMPIATSPSRRPTRTSWVSTIYSETRGTAEAMAKEKRQKEIIQAARSKKRAPVMTAAE